MDNCPWCASPRAFSPCARSRIPISRSPCPATFVSQTKSTHFVEENPNLLVVISAELRMLPNEWFCSPSLKRSSFLGNKGHVRDCPYQSMQFLPELSFFFFLPVYMKYPVRGSSPIAVHGPIAVHSAIFSHLFWTVYFTTQWSTITGPSPIAVHAPITVHGSWNEKTSDVFIWIFLIFFFFLENERKSDEEENERGSDRERSGGAEKR